MSSAKKYDGWLALGWLTDRKLVAEILDYRKRYTNMTTAAVVRMLLRRGMTATWEGLAKSEPSPPR